jgi:hypothetical protein
MSTFGPAYETKFDEARVMNQMERVRRFMLEASSAGQWLTLEEIGRATSDPVASVSAQLRHLRKAAFGSYTVLKRSRGDRLRGLFEYYVVRSEAAVSTSGVQLDAGTH